MTHGRIEVFNNDNRGAVIARFMCNKASTERDMGFHAFYHLVCRYLYDTEGNWGQLSQSQLQEVLEAKAHVEATCKDEIQLTDVEYIEL